MTNEAYIRELCQRHLGDRPSATCLEELAALPAERPDVHAFVERMFRLMQRAGFSSRDLSVLHGEVIGSLLSRILPGAWEGRVPPITLAGRHARIDEYLARNRWQPLPDSGTFVDVGCGFPPLTTVDAADRLPGWQVIGADPSLPSYLVYDGEDNYATFDQDRRMVYCQPEAPTVENWNTLLADPAATRARFEGLLAAMSDGSRQADDARVITKPLRQYEREGLSFNLAGIGDLDVEEADVVRCLNVLFYFDEPFQQGARSWFREVLRDGGLLITGADWAHTTECRYYVHQKHGDRLTLREYAFSVDNVCPIAVMPWFTLHDDDEDLALLTELLRVLKADTAFHEAIVARSDALREGRGICPRGADGHYGRVDPGLSAAELWDGAAQIGRTLAEEFVDDAVGVLQTAGYEAWRNEVDHIAVRPDR